MPCYIDPKTNHDMNIHENLSKLIPFIGDDVISYPLWEEGRYIPSLNFWQVVKTQAEADKLE